MELRRKKYNEHKTYKNYNLYNYKTSEIRSYKRTNYFYDRLFDRFLRLNYNNNIQKHYKLLQIDYTKKINTLRIVFFNRRQVLWT